MHAGFEVVVALMRAIRFAQQQCGYYYVPGLRRRLHFPRLWSRIALGDYLLLAPHNHIGSSRLNVPFTLNDHLPTLCASTSFPLSSQKPGIRRLLVLLTGNIPLSFHTTFPDAFHYQGHLLDIDTDDEEEVLSKIADQPQEVQAEYRHHLKLLARHRLFNKMVKETDRKWSHIMSSPMQESFLGIVRYGLRSWTDSAYGLRHALLGLCDEWDLISDGADCPIAFSEEEIELHCEVLEKGESRAQRRTLLCEEAGCNPDGGVKSEAYDEVKAKAEALRKKWSPEELGPWPLQDGASTSLL